MLSGVATTTNDALSVISGGLYNLNPGEAIRMTVQFMPTAAETYIGNLVIEGGGYATIYLRGYGTRADALACNAEMGRFPISGGSIDPTAEAASCRPAADVEAGNREVSHFSKDAAGDGLLVALCAAALLLARRVASRPRDQA